MKAHLINTHLLVPRSRSSAKVKVKYKGYISQKMAVSGAFVFHKNIFSLSSIIGDLLIFRGASFDTLQAPSRFPADGMHIMVTHRLIVDLSKITLEDISLSSRQLIPTSAVFSMATICWVPTATCRCISGISVFDHQFFGNTNAN